jgi:putative transposase
MTAWLQNEGHPVNKKRVRRLLRLMGLETIYPKPRLSRADKDHRKYPYLLSGVKIGKPNQVWFMDITGVPLHQGFVYLMAVIDW